MQPSDAYRIPRWLKRYWRHRPPHAAALRTNAPGPSAPIAVIGASAHLPMAPDLATLWNNLLAGKDCISSVPPDRWDWHGIRGDSPDSEAGLHRGGYIDGVDEFDTLLFNISPREAALMDPAQRLLLLYTWKAIEDAGYAAHSLAGTDTGVFLGALGHDYIRLSTRADQPAEGYTSTGLMPSVGPGRVSHYFDLRGPSEAMETACSSALVAVHRAVCAIRNGECDTAIAAGISLLLTPDLTLSFARAGMLSPDGRCKAFSQNANGYVRGEGIGVLVLKDLSRAERDGDHIYGVIRATVVNHCGRSRSLTAPNPEAQAELLYRAYSQAAIDPSTVGYVEAHGTGTPLGDPIEVEALKAAFDRLYRERGVAPRPAHCGLGSIKSNIGHLEFAAGIAGMIKVLLQLQHRALVPTLHCEQINRYVVLDDSPFYLVRKTQPWTPVMEKGRPLPLRAGVSSFGYGGVNSHVVIEEYCPADRRPVRAKVSPVLLSARDPELLYRQAETLLRAVDDIATDPWGLLDASYTLACGREGMQERLGLVVDSVQELKQKLTAFLAGDADAHAMHRGQSGSRTTTQQQGPAELSDALRDKALVDSLVGRWVEGVDIDWAAVFAGEGARRRSLPPSAFALRRFPLPRSRPSNSGDLSVQRRDLWLTGQERFLEHHRIQGERLLPAVMYLESVRSAFASGTDGLDQSQLLRFSAVSWLAPLTVNAPISLSIWLHATAPRQARFEAGVQAADADRPTTINASGTIAIEASGGRPVLDLTETRGRCTRARFSQQDCYEAFAELGFHYGPGHRAVRSLQVGQNEVLARLESLEAAADTVDRGELQPGILDGALQSIIGLQLAGDRPCIGPGSRPFKCETVEIFAGSSGARWARVTTAAAAQGDAEDRSFDIDLCDEDGAVCVRFRGFTLRGEAGVRELLVAPTWISLPVASRSKSPQVPTGVVVVIGGNAEEHAALRLQCPGVHVAALSWRDDPTECRRQLASCGNISHVVWLVPADVPTSLRDESIVESQNHGVLFALKLAQALLSAGYETQSLLWTTVTRGAAALHVGEHANPTHAGLQGFMGALANEYPQWTVQVLDVPAATAVPVAALFGPVSTKRGLCAYRNGRWFQRRACVVEQMTSARESIAPGAVYVIIGGAGGIGQAISRALLEQSQVQLVWIGRRTEDAAIRSMLDELAAIGRPPLYVRANICDRAELESARGSIERTFGRIDGLIHAAMVLHDQSVERLSAESLREVLASKIDGAVRLAQVFASAELKFALFFSSMNSFGTFAGQSNYAAASCFEDAFAVELAKSWRCRVRVINWGYWGEVGAGASDFHRSRMARAGIASIRTTEAMRVIQTVLAAPLIQCGYIKVAASADLETLGIDAEHQLIVDEPAPSYVAPALNVEWHGKQPDALVREQQTLDCALLQAMSHRLQPMCGFDRPLTVRAARDNAGIQPKYARWLERSVAELVAHGDLQRTDDLLSATDRASVRAESLRALPDVFKGDEQREKQWQFAQTILDALPEILTGRRDALDVMFSEPAASLIAETYRNDPVIGHCDRVLAAVAADYVAGRLEREPGSRIRLLEIGAGQGATAKCVVAALRPQQHAIAEYAYTDVSPAFLADERTADLKLPAYVTYRKFDVESDPRLQELSLGAYDIVIASNVLHATQSLETALRHCKSLLKSGGVLLLQELSANAVFAHLTYGLLDGWWRFDDAKLRVAGGPAASPGTWGEVLRRAGFCNVAFPAEQAHAHAHQVIVAQSDGIVLLAGINEINDEVRHADSRQVPSEPVQVATPGKISVEELLPQLRTLVAQVLGMAEAELDRQSRPFSEALLGEIGMDSLASINLRKSMRRTLGVDIPTRQILGQTAGTIADAVHKQLLLRQMIAQAPLPDAAEVETFTF